MDYYDGNSQKLVCNYGIQDYHSPNTSDILNLIEMVNIDEEIDNMLDALYVNDEPEFKFTGGGNKKINTD